MGLELSLARLKALAKFAFGMGLTQVTMPPTFIFWLRTGVGGACQNVVGG